MTEATTPSAWTRMVEGTAQAIHAVRGTHGILFAGSGLLVLAILGFALPTVVRAIVALPLLLLLLAGLFTLPREGVAAQGRALALQGDPDAARRMRRRLVWPILLIVFLLPRVFLALFGIPHLNPLTGLAPVWVHQRVAATTLYAVLLLAVLHLRSGRSYAPDIRVQRPKDLSRNDGRHDDRDVLLMLQIVLLGLWSWLLWPFWRPLAATLFQPSVDTLANAAVGVAGAAFGLVLPLLMWTTLVAHGRLLHALVEKRALRRHREIALLAAVHVVLALTAILLHAYNALWIARYQIAARF